MSCPIPPDAVKLNSHVEAPKQNASLEMRSRDDDVHDGAIVERPFSIRSHRSHYATGGHIITHFSDGSACAITSHNTIHDIPSIIRYDRSWSLPCVGSFVDDHSNQLFRAADGR